MMVYRMATMFAGSECTSRNAFLAPDIQLLTPIFYQAARFRSGTGTGATEREVEWVCLGTCANIGMAASH
jgi:hypothetical protein